MQLSDLHWQNCKRLEGWLEKGPRCACAAAEAARSGAKPSGVMLPARRRDVARQALK